MYTKSSTTNSTQNFQPIDTQVLNLFCLNKSETKRMINCIERKNLGNNWKKSAKDKIETKMESQTELVI